MNNAFAKLLTVWTAGPMLSIALTLAAFLVANWLFARFRRPLWMPPVLIAALLLAAVVALSGIGFEEYEQGARWLTVLLGPATVALGVPLYQQMHHKIGRASCREKEELRATAGEWRDEEEAARNAA